VAVARARRRFWGALFWALVIYFIAGLVVPIAVFSLARFVTVTLPATATAAAEAV
jgi:hypothetical protein